MKIVIIFSALLIITSFSGCIDSSEKDDEDYNQVYIVVLFNPNDYSYNFTTSFDLFVENESKLSVRNHTFQPISPMTLSAEPFNTTKDEIFIEVKEYDYGLKNFTKVDVSKEPYILILLNVPDEILFEPSEQIIDLA